MTTADRLRAAVEAALPDGWLVLKPGFDDFREADSGLREIVLAAVLPIVEERDAEIVQMEARKDAAYLERNQVVAALARMFPSGIARTAIEGWSEDWHGCVYIDLPTGQVSWHYHDSQAYLFDGLPPYTVAWDGHDTPEKYRRLAALRGDARDAEIARLREVLEWAHTILPTPCCESCAMNARSAMTAALRGDWPAVRAAGVALPRDTSE